MNRQLVTDSVSGILEAMKIEGIYLGEADEEVKPGRGDLEKMAIQAVNQALRFTLSLHSNHSSFSEAAHLLEKVQIAAAQAERAAALARRSIRAHQAYEEAQRLAEVCRRRFHEIKAEQLIKTSQSSE